MYSPLAQFVGAMGGGRVVYIQMRMDFWFVVSSKCE